LLVIPMVFLGCSKDDDPNENCSFELVIRISPEGAGTVERSFRQGSSAWGELPSSYRLEAIPNEGYVFKYWIYGVDAFGPVEWYSNPFGVACKAGPGDITAVFEEIGE